MLPQRHCQNAGPQNSATQNSAPQMMGNPMNQWLRLFEKSLMTLLDNLLEKLFDYGEPALSDVVTQMLEAKCREH